MSTKERAALGREKLLKGKERPPRSIVNVEGIPDSIKQLKRWVCWRWKWDNKKWTKEPTQISGRSASSTDDSTWTSFDSVMVSYKSNPAIAGIGFILGGGFAGVDLDSVIDPITCEADPIVFLVCETLDSHCETSPTGTGVKILCRGKLPIGRRQSAGDAEYDVECYDGGRFFTITGQTWGGTKQEVNERTDELAWFHRTYIDTDRSRSEGAKPRWTYAAGGEVEKARDAIANISPRHADSYADWIRVGMAAKTVGGNELLDDWIEWSAKSPNYGGAEACEKKWSVLPDHSDIGMGTLVRLAKESGWCPSWAANVIDPAQIADDSFTVDDLIARRGKRRNLKLQPADVAMIDRAAFALDDLLAEGIDPTADAGGKLWGFKASQYCFAYGLSEKASVSTFKAAQQIDDRGTDGTKNQDDKTSAPSVRGDWNPEAIKKRIASVRKHGDIVFGEGLVTILRAETWNDNARLARRVLAIHGYDPFDNTNLTLRSWQGEFYLWVESIYRKRSNEQIESIVTEVCFSQRLAENDRSVKRHESAVKKAEAEDKTIPTYKPPADITPAKVSAVIAAMRCICTVDESINMPAWIRPEGMPPANAVLSCRNGIFELTDDGFRKLFDKPTPAFFSTAGLSFECDPYETCPEWETTLEQWWPGDEESKLLFQQWCGSHLSPEILHHKMLIDIGPPRSGKGIRREILGEITGHESVTTPKLAELGQQFGLQGWGGKRAAFLADARMGRNSDAIAIGEALLGIVGGDPQNIQRKNLPTLFSVSLPVKITLFSNEVPTMFDSSGALASRFLTLRTTRSFLGAEDVYLRQRLRAELPGILNWALRGLQSLRMTGEFTQPENARQMARDIADTYSPVRVFVRDCCEVDDLGKDSARSAEKHRIYEWWCEWCNLQGIEKPGTMAIFFRNLYAAYPCIITYRAPPSNPDNPETASRLQKVKGIALTRIPFIDPGWQG